MSHVTKLILCVIMARTKAKIKQEISDEQCGFVKDSRTMNSIFVLKMFGEASIEMQQKWLLCFIVNAKAFDKAQHRSLIEILDSINSDGRDLRLLTFVYWEQKAAVRVAESVRQGCVLSSDLFNI